MEYGGDAYATLAADVVAPCYVAYVKWLLNDAQKRGIKRLYFLSRDGYILMKIAENMEHDGIELRYLFLSLLFQGRFNFFSIS
jgi:predicted HAD superfamily hydrolase